MTKRLTSVCLLMAFVTVGSRFAAGAVEPLLVVVETRPGSAVDPTEVRHAIATELGTSVRAPRDGTAEETSDVLIVSVDRAKIQMSLRTRTMSVVSRAVPAPGDRNARLQSIGWLAGNLARDQVSAILASAPAPAAVPAASREEESPAQAEVPPAPSAATDPPPLPAVAPRTDSLRREPATEPSAVVTGRSAAATGSADPTWSLGIGGGPSALWSGLGDREQPVWPGPGIWYLELQRRGRPNGLILGAALDVGPDMALGIHSSSVDFIGACGLVGLGRRFGRAFIEATAGPGVEAYQSYTQLQNDFVVPPSGADIEVEAVPTIRLGLYLRGQATAGVALSRSFDLLASLGGHVGTVSSWDHFLTSSLGVRYRFQ